MKINQYHHYQAEESTSTIVANGLRSLIQIYASELNFHELLSDSIVEQLNWDYLERVLMQQLELHPRSAAQESNYDYYQTLKQTFENMKKDNQ